MLSTGTPMFVAGDERWRTQGGNNNAYCLDDPTSWVDWTATDEADAMLTFARRVIHLRADSPALRQPEFFDGRTTPTGRPDLIWLRPDGHELDEDDWEQTTSVISSACGSTAPTASPARARASCCRTTRGCC